MWEIESGGTAYHNIIWNRTVIPPTTIKPDYVSLPTT